MSSKRSIYCGAGRTPFHDRNRRNIQQNILNAKLKLPKWLTIHAQSLLKGLLRKTLSVRIGTKGGAKELKVLYIISFDLDAEFIL